MLTQYLGFTDLLAFQQYALLKNAQPYRVLENKEKLPWSVYVGVCGMPGEWLNNNASGDDFNQHKSNKAKQLITLGKSTPTLRR